MGLRELLEKDLDELKKIPGVNIETLPIYGTKPLIEIDGIELDTDYKKYKHILKDLRKKLSV